MSIDVSEWKCKLAYLNTLSIRFFLFHSSSISRSLRACKTVLKLLLSIIVVLDKFSVCQPVYIFLGQEYDLILCLISENCSW